MNIDRLKRIRLLEEFMGGGKGSGPNGSLRFTGSEVAANGQRNFLNSFSSPI